MLVGQTRASKRIEKIVEERTAPKQKDTKENERNERKRRTMRETCQRQIKRESAEQRARTARRRQTTVPGQCGRECQQCHPLALARRPIVVRPRQRPTSQPHSTRRGHRVLPSERRANFGGIVYGPHIATVVVVKEDLDDVAIPVRRSTRDAPDRDRDHTRQADLHIWIKTKIQEENDIVYIGNSTGIGVYESRRVLLEVSTERGARSEGAGARILVVADLGREVVPDIPLAKLIRDLPGASAFH